MKSVKSSKLNLPKLIVNDMIFRPIDYGTDIYGLEAAHLAFRELLGDPRAYNNARDLYKSMTFGWDNYCLEDEQAGALVGVGSLDLADTHFGLARIENIAVTPKYRGESLGRFLVASLEDKSREAGASLVRLTTLGDAEGFYLKLGYELISDNNPYELAKPL